MFIPQHFPMIGAKVLLAALASMTLTACSDSSAVEQDVDRLVRVRAAPVVSAMDNVEPLRFAGVVRSRQRAGLTFQVGGVLSSRSAEVGQDVQAGQVLATLYNPELEPVRDAAQARVRELQAQAEQARRDVERARQLYDKGVVPASEHEQQKARLDALLAGVSSARAAAQQASRMQGESQLKAPFDGSVEAVLVEPGEYVGAGQPVLRIAAAEGYEVEIKAPAAMLDDLATGDAINVWRSAGGAPLAGRVVDIGKGVSSGALYPLIVALPPESVRSGDAVEVGLQRRRSGAYAVPLASVMRSAEGTAVFQVVDGRALRVPVTVDSVQGEAAVLETSSLAEGDQVVYAGLTRLADGDAVELLP